MIKCEAHGALMTEVRNSHKILIRKPKGRNDLEHLTDGRIILKLILDMTAGPSGRAL